MPDGLLVRLWCYFSSSRHFFVTFPDRWLRHMLTWVCDLQWESSVRRRQRTVAGFCWCILESCYSHCSSTVNRWRDTVDLSSRLPGLACGVTATQRSPTFKTTSCGVADSGSVYTPYIYIVFSATLFGFIYTYIHFNYLIVYHVIILYFSVLLLIVFYYALCIMKCMVFTGM